MKKVCTLVFVISLCALYSCKKDNVKGSGTGTTPVSGNKLAPDGFNFSTTKNVALNITLHTNNDQPLAGVMVNVYLPGNSGNSQAIFRALTNKNGQITGTVTVPSYETQLVIDPLYLGVLRNALANINGSSITGTIGGKNTFSGDIVAPTGVPSGSTAAVRNLSQRNLNTPNVTGQYPTGYTAANAYFDPANLGRPKWLSPTPDVVTSKLLNYVNSSLPEYQNVATTHPQYLNGATTVLNVVQTSDVTLTFVSAYASNHNTLAYYTYPTNNPPQTVNDIGKITYIFPNATFSGAYGAMNSGDKVDLGTFNAGTTIAFVLFQNAWNWGDVGSCKYVFFSQIGLNPETNPSLQQHSIVLYDADDNLELIGFEDRSRQYEISDNDFNDLVFYTTATGIDNTGIPPVDPGCPDSDGDGVDDCHDQYPNDPNKAYNSYYPSATTYANIAFEDNWPTKGDYDMNDLVVLYQYEFISNAQNQVVSMVDKIALAAAGASFQNGFGVQLPVPASSVASVTGLKLSSGTYIQLASNGVEAGQTKAVLIPFDTHQLLLHNPDYSILVNTLMSKDKVASDTATVTVNFTSPVDPNTLTPSAFNPFLISNMRRGYEVHLPGYSPTDMADTKLFGAGDDNSNPATGRYYLTADNWPWAINFVQTFNYPIETINITQAFLHFTDWAASGGTTYQDWYSNTAAGYRNTANIYSK